jgi:tetratricopeptide (TPR) repeat protein
MIDPKTAARILGGEYNGQEILCPGPGHSSKDRSLKVKISANAPDGFVVHSYAGDNDLACKDYVRQQLGLESFETASLPDSGEILRQMAEKKRKANGDGATVVDAREQFSPGRTVVARYDYKDREGVLLYQVERYDPKSFRQRRPNGQGGWEYKQGDRRVLYRWPELVAAGPDAPLFVCEGEKDADRVASLGYCATTVANGSWDDVEVADVAGRDVLILQDNDNAGRKKAIEAAQALCAVAKTMRIVELPGLPMKGDVSDWLDANPANAERLADVCFEAPAWTRASAEESAGDGAAARGLELLSSADFIANFVAPDYLVDGILLRSYCYAMTAPTGTGKTAILLLLAACIALGRALGNRGVEAGAVCFLAGENPDDVRARWIALAEHLGFDANTIPVHFIEGVFPLAQIKDVVARKSKEHPDTAFSLNNLAVLLENQGNLAEAQPLFERALAIYENVRGPEHGATAAVLNNLALLLQDQGKLAEARPLFERALAISEKALGPEHPNTATDMSNLARVLRDTGHANEAEPLFQKAIAIGEKALGRDHSTTQRYASHYARLLVQTGRAKEALATAQSALATHEAASGPIHPWTKDSARVTADALDALGRTEEAKALRERYGVIRPVKPNSS